MRPLSLAGLLVRLRYRSLWNGARRAPGGARLAWLLVALAPVAYVGLFATAFALVAGEAQRAVVALVAGTITFASATGKMATSQTVIGGSGENEFLLARPVSLPALVVARSLAGVATDLFDALFLFPVLVAAVWVWRLGAVGVLVAAATSVLVQVAVSAVAQAGQITLVRLVPPVRRRLAWSLLALLAALAMALLWVIGSWIVRRPELIPQAVGPWSAALRRSPGGLVAAPLLALTGGSPLSCLVPLAALAVTAAASVVGARGVAAWAGAAGWEQASLPWAERARGPAPARPITLFSKDWRLLVRDRSRLVTLVALPVIFVGLHVFGVAGWTWTTGGPRRMAVLAFSIAGYMATFGPLAHMEGERQAFWLLRVVPVPLGRLLAAKARFWSVIIGGTAALVGGGLLLGSGLPVTGPALAVMALAVVGAVTVTWLAVAMAAGAADFSDERRRMALSSVYLFLFLEGLYNVVLLEHGELQARGLALFVVAVGLHWISGVERAEAVYDRERRPSDLGPGAGATMAILLFLGTRAQRLALTGTDALLGHLTWAAVIAVAGVVALARHHVLRRPRLVPALLVGAAVVLVAVLACSGAVQGGLVLAVALTRALAEELAARGMVQGALARRGWRLGGAAVSVVVALAAGARPLGATAVAAAVLPALSTLATGSLAAALGTRMLVELAAAL